MRVYKAPSEEMKIFLAKTIKKLTGLERLETPKLAKLLLEKFEGKTSFHTNNIGDHFSWLHKIGVLDYERKYVPSGGWRLFLFRKCGESEVEALVMGAEDLSIAEGEDPKPAVNDDTSKKKKRKSCCDNPHVVKSKKTGKRRCKNCKTPYPSKKPDACASACCDNPHPVKSRKTGKRRCKNCGTPLPPKKKKG